MEDPTKLDSSGNENKTAIKANTTADVKSGNFVAGTVLAINILGDGLRDTLDPKMAKRV